MECGLSGCARGNRFLLMAEEIERKFLLKEGVALGEALSSARLAQGYVDATKASVRVRIKGDECFLTLKTARKGQHRLEFEYPIPKEDGLEMLKELCNEPLIDKTRSLVEYEGHTWEVDTFHGENEGLVVAEIETEVVGQDIPLPPWVGKEVTDERRYSNASLSRHPFCDWVKE